MEVLPSRRGVPPKSVLNKSGQFPTIHVSGKRVGGKAMISAPVLNDPRNARIKGVKTTNPNKLRRMWRMIIPPFFWKFFFFSADLRFNAFGSAGSVVISFSPSIVQCLPQ